MRPRFFDRVRPSDRAAAARRRLALPLAVALYSALAVYCLLSVIAGPAGAIAYRGLEERKTAMAANLSNLSATNERLRGELEALRSDADRLAREARGIGYLRHDETAVILAGRNAPLPSMDAGSLLPLVPPRALPDSALKEIALGSGLAVLALILAPRKKR